MITSEAVRFSQRVRKEEREMFSGKWQGTRSTLGALFCRSAIKNEPPPAKLPPREGNRTLRTEHKTKRRRKKYLQGASSPSSSSPLSSRARQGRSHSHRRATLSPPPWRLGAVISAKCYSFPGPIIQNIARPRELACASVQQQQLTSLLMRFVRTLSPPCLITQFQESPANK